MYYYYDTDVRELDVNEAGLDLASEFDTAGDYSSRLIPFGGFGGFFPGFTGGLLGGFLGGLIRPYPYYGGYYGGFGYGGFPYYY